MTVAGTGAHGMTIFATILGIIAAIGTKDKWVIIGVIVMIILSIVGFFI